MYNPDNENRILIDFEKVIVDTFVDNVWIETVIGSPNLIYNNVALYYHESTNSSDFIYLE
jgi:hypothetical protein